MYPDNIYCIDFESHFFNKYYKYNKYNELNLKYNKYKKIDEYILTILYNIFKDIIPSEIIKNIHNYLKDDDLNYQWLEIRKKYNLFNSPLNLDFNLNNYKELCSKYMKNLNIAFVFNTTMYPVSSGFKKSVYFYFLYSTNPDIKEININSLKKIHVIYNIGDEVIAVSDKKMILNLTNLNIKEMYNKIENINIYNDEMLIYCFNNKVINSEKWKSYLNIKDKWIDFLLFDQDEDEENDQDLLEILSSECDRIEENQKVFKKLKESNNYFSLNVKKWIKIFYSIHEQNWFVWPIGLKEKYNNEQIKLFDFIKEIIYYNTQCIGIMIDNKFALNLNSYFHGYYFPIIEINSETGDINISNITKLLNTEKITITELIEEYGDLLLQ